MRHFYTIGALLLGAATASAAWFSPPSWYTSAIGGNAALAQELEHPDGNIEADIGDGNLRVCNQTANPVSIALGYRAERGWQSEGWWVAGPDECKTVYAGDVASRRYYYLYVADDIGGGSWDGNVFMCTRDETFTIFGVEDCLARGYERTGFFEIDTQNRSSWMLRLTDNQIPSDSSTDAVDATLPIEGEIGTENIENLPVDENVEGTGD